MKSRIALLLVVHIFAICNYEAYAAPCAEDEDSQDCRAFVDANAKARVQLRLERRLREFENGELR
jgi:hypothetical protein